MNCKQEDYKERRRVSVAANRIGILAERSGAERSRRDRRDGAESERVARAAPLIIRAQCSPFQCLFARLLDQIEFARQLVQLPARPFCGSPRKTCNF